jgi:hypothetical protein
MNRVGWMGLALGLACSPAVAAEITIRPFSSVPDAAIVYIARNSVPTVLKGKRTALATEIRNACGSLTEAYLAIAEEINRTPSAEGLLLPACVHWQRNVAVEVQDGDDLSTMIRREMGLSADAPLPCGKDETSPRCNKPLRDLVAQLNPGTDLQLLKAHSMLTLPFQTRFQAIKLRPDVEPKAALEEIRTLVESTAIARLSSDVSMVRQFGIDQIDMPECKMASSKSRSPWPYDTALVAKVLDHNIRVSKSNHFGITPTIVAVLDSGISGKGDFFPNRYFAANLGELGKKKNNDNDGNRFKNDLFGTNADGRGDIEAYGGDPLREHGSAVANLVLGSRPFRQQFKTLDELLKLKIVRMVKPYENGKFSITDLALEEGLKYAWLTASVANISVGTDDKTFRLLKYLRIPPGLVAVVAAGNDTAKLGEVSVYPANLGGTRGDAPNNVITVAAYRSDGQLAEFSNYGERYVDIAAPGCDLTYQEKGPRLFGTSFAAPLVTFTVALLRSFKVGLGVETKFIKQRLEASVDFDRRLKAVAFSGRLNVPKALSVFQDVLEINVNDTDKELKFGNADYRSSSTDVHLCHGFEGAFFPPNSIRKITPFLDETGGQKLRILRFDEALQLDSVECTPFEDEFAFTEDGFKSRGWKWKDIADFVPRFEFN